MMTVITIFVILIFFILLGLAVGGFLAWQKISIFLTWNTRYQEADYETALAAPKMRKPAGKASKTQQRGRAITPTDNLVDLADLSFEDAVAAVERAGE